MGDQDDPRMATEVARAFALGGDPVLTGPVAGGRLGDIWRLETDREVWAVKETRGQLDVAEAEAQASYQEQVLAGSTCGRVSGGSTRVLSGSWSPGCTASWCPVPVRCTSGTPTRSRPHGGGSSSTSSSGPGHRSWTGWRPCRTASPRWPGSSRRTVRCSGATGTCSPTTSWPPPTAVCASWTGTRAAPPTPPVSWPSCSWSSASASTTAPSRSWRRTPLPGVRAGCGHSRTSRWRYAS